MSLSTKGMANKGGMSKTMKPGNVYAKILKIYLEEDKYQREQKGNDGAYFVKLNLEGVDIGEGFEGFWLNPDNHELGRHKGQVGSVKANSGFSYFDKVANGKEYNRDNEILRLLSDIATQLNKRPQLDEIDAPTIEEYIEKASDLLSGDDSWLNFCLGGQEYQKNGYPAYALFLARGDYKAKKYSFSYDEDNVVKFKKADHVIVKKKTENEVSEFEPASTGEEYADAESVLPVSNNEEEFATVDSVLEPDDTEDELPF